MYACGPEYDEPACCAPEDEQYTGAYGTPYSDHYGSRPSIGMTTAHPHSYSLNYLMNNITNYYFLYLSLSVATDTKDTLVAKFSLTFT